MFPIEGIKKKGKPLSKNKVIKVDPSSYAILHEERTEKLAKVVALVHLPGLVQWTEQNRTAPSVARPKSSAYLIKPTRPINSIKQKRAE